MSAEDDLVQEPLEPESDPMMSLGIDMPRYVSAYRRPK